MIDETKLPTPEQIEQWLTDMREAWANRLDSMPPRATSTTKLDEILAEREARYGDYRHVANVSKKIHKAIKKNMSKGQPAYISDAIWQISSRLGRISCGDPMYTDTWMDIAGFCTRVIQLINEDRP